MPGDARPRRVSGLSGTVERGRFATGSKSERHVTWLQTDQDRFVLRRKDGPSYGDTALDRYVGQRVRCDGFVVGNLLLVEHVEVVP